MTTQETPTARRGRRAQPRRSFGAALLGFFGELMITAGVLLGLFVVWQLWWTDVVAEAEQDRIVAGLDWETPPPAPADPAADPEALKRRDAPPVMEEPEHGEVFGVISVPRWGPDYEVPIAQGTTRRDVLDVLGTGHYEGTAMPGEVGNFSVAGHRVTYGKPFNRVEELEDGDAVIVRTEDTWYVYKIERTQIVWPRQVEVIAPVPDEPGVEPTVPMMTLTTCHPMWSARERFIVHAAFDYWMPVSDGTPEEMSA